MTWSDFYKDRNLTKDADHSGTVRARARWETHATGDWVQNDHADFCTGLNYSIINKLLFYSAENEFIR